MSLEILPAELRTNVRFVDEQHAQLLQIADDIYSEFNTNTDKVKLEELVNFLAVYTEIHFNEEEKMMQDLGYEGLEAHKKEHDNFKCFIESAQNDIRQLDDLSVISSEVISSLKDWIVEHVKGTDIKMAQQINIPKSYK